MFTNLINSKLSTYLFGLIVIVIVILIVALKKMNKSNYWRIVSEGKYNKDHIKNKKVLVTRSQPRSTLSGLGKACFKTCSK